VRILPLRPPPLPLSEERRADHTSFQRAAGERAAVRSLSVGRAGDVLGGWGAVSGGEVGGEWWGVGGVIGVGVEVVWGWWVGCDACFVYAEFVEYPTTLVTPR